MTLRLFNTRTRQKEVFEPIEPGHARVYSCGPTVYAPQHIGNLRPYLFADLLKRALLAEGLRVTLQRPGITRKQMHEHARVIAELELGLAPGSLAPGSLAAAST